MEQPALQRKYIWPGMLRLAHWGMALAVIVLLVTAWLLHWTPTVATAASDYHQIAGALLMLLLLLRFWLLFTDRTVAGWQALVPSRQSLSGMVAMLRFYVTFGGAPLPGWYAHNPLWMPVYAVLFLLLAVLSLTGFFMTEHPVVLGVYLPSLHRSVAPLIGLFTFAHIIAVVMHDARGKLADVSGMLNGFRLFEIKQPDIGKGTTEHRVSLDSLKVKSWRPGDDE